ncbi:hypothetical protein Tco_0086581 [Tanacetum coccineum]
MSPKNKEHYQSEKEAIHLLLTRIGDELYSTVDACKIAHDMWIAIEIIHQGESLNIQDVKTNLFWEFGKFTSHDEESMEPYYSRFYKIMNEVIRNNLTVATMRVNVQFLQQLQPEWSRFVTIVKQNHDLDTSANPLALVAAAQHYPDPYYQAPKSHKSYAPPSKQSSSTRSHESTKYKGKEIAKLITPPSENKNVDTSPRYKTDNQTGQFKNQRTVTVAEARDTVGSQLEDTDEEIDEQELEAHYSYMEKIQEVHTADSRTDTKPLEKVDSNVIPDSPDMCDNDIQTGQNAKECDDELVALANLIANLTLDTEENKNILKQLKKANASLTQELKECKSNLEESNTTQDIA